MLVWIVGVVVGVVFAIAAIRVPGTWQKAIVIVSTALIGGWVIAATFLFLFTSASAESLAERRRSYEHPLRVTISPLSPVGMLFQLQVIRAYEIEPVQPLEASIGRQTGTPPSAAM